MLTLVVLTYNYEIKYRSFLNDPLKNHISKEKAEKLYENITYIINIKWNKDK